MLSRKIDSFLEFYLNETTNYTNNNTENGSGFGFSQLHWRRYYLKLVAGDLFDMAFFPDDNRC